VAGQTYGHTFWLKSYELTATGNRYKRGRPDRCASNDLLGQEPGARMLLPMPCVHTAIAHSEVKNDGTFAWRG